MSNYWNGDHTLDWYFHYHNLNLKLAKKIIYDKPKPFFYLTFYPCPNAASIIFVTLTRTVLFWVDPYPPNICAIGYVVGVRIKTFLVASTWAWCSTRCRIRFRFSVVSLWFQVTPVNSILFFTYQKWLIIHNKNFITTPSRSTDSLQQYLDDCFVFFLKVNTLKKQNILMET